jgi:SlyX protein
MRISGKMSVGVRSAASGPTMRISSASTTKVYGRVSAMRTRLIIAVPCSGAAAAVAGFLLGIACSTSISERRAARQPHCGIITMPERHGGASRGLRAAAPAATPGRGRAGRHATFRAMRRTAMSDPHAPSPAEERLDALEIRIAYQDEAIESLNQTVSAQWAQIEALSRKVAELADRIREAESRAVPSGQSEPPPPHY